jgi:hypothetical protein
MMAPRNSRLSSSSKHLDPPMNARRGPWVVQCDAQACYRGVYRRAGHGISPVDVDMVGRLLVGPWLWRGRGFPRRSGVKDGLELLSQYVVMEI